jgi:hypothetical protein
VWRLVIVFHTLSRRRNIVNPNLIINNYFSSLSTVEMEPLNNARLIKLTPSLLYSGYGGFIVGVKRPGRPSSTEVKNGGAIPPLPHISSWHSA